MTDRIIPCISYVCAGADCLKGKKEVTMKKCQTCKKYRPRKTSKRPEPVGVKRRKDRERHDNWKREY